jgi:hypothetical protein
MPADCRQFRTAGQRCQPRSHRGCARIVRVARSRPNRASSPSPEKVSTSARTAGTDHRRLPDTSPWTFVGGTIKPPSSTLAGSPSSTSPARRQWPSHETEPHLPICSCRLCVHGRPLLRAPSCATRAVDSWRSRVSVADRRIWQRWVLMLPPPDGAPARSTLQEQSTDLSTLAGIVTGGMVAAVIPTAPRGSQIPLPHASQCGTPLRWHTAKPKLRNVTDPILPYGQTATHVSATFPGRGDRSR